MSNRSAPGAGSRALGGGQTLIAAGLLNSALPSPDYRLALRGAQAGFSSPLDQSAARRDPALNQALFPATFVAGATYTTGQYVSAAIPDGILRKVTTGGIAAAEPSWTATIGNTNTSGAVTFTAEKGPWYIASTGNKQLRTLANSQIGAAGSYVLPPLGYDLARNMSLIVNVRGAFSWSGSGQASESGVLGDRPVSGLTRGVALIASGGSFNDLRLRIGDGTNSFTMGHVAAGFGRKPLDGAMRTTTFMIDGPTKMAYGFADGVAYTQSDMFDASNLSPHGANLAAITGSTDGGNNLVFGTLPSSATTFELGIAAIDIIVLDRPLPADIQAIANWFSQRGDGLLPWDLVRG